MAGHWYVPKRSMRFIRRNALVALGNISDAAAAPLLAGYLGHPDSLLRLHAAWALGMLGTSDARATLAVAAAGETDAEVLATITSALTARSMSGLKTPENDGVSVYAEAERDDPGEHPEGSQHV